MRCTARAGAVALGVTAMAVLLAGAAIAAPVPAPGKHPAVTSPSPAALPARYVVVNSGVQIAPAGIQVYGSVNCPAKTVPYGGGVFTNSSSVLVNVASSYPTPSGWEAGINNAAPDDSAYLVYAVCAKQNASWTIVEGTAVTNLPDQRDQATATCPSGDKVLSGGALSSSSSLAVSENSTVPTRTGTGTAATYGWSVTQNNGSAESSVVEPFAVCGRAPGYKQVIGKPVTNAAGAQTGTTVSCPPGKVPLGGGMLSGSASLLVNLNTSYPVSGGWSVFQDNDSAGPATFRGYAICAGT